MAIRNDVSIAPNVELTDSIKMGLMPLNRYYTDWTYSSFYKCAN
uniref:Uncharacterized protein n=1 Tax=Anguilla anguilla TaxID=7936 RepID=A0A0E9S4P4_ANGAN